MSSPRRKHPPLTRRRPLLPPGTAPPPNYPPPPPPQHPQQVQQQPQYEQQHEPPPQQFTIPNGYFLVATQPCVQLSSLSRQAYQGTENASVWLAARPSMQPPTMMPQRVPQMPPGAYPPPGHGMFMPLGFVPLMLPPPAKRPLEEEEAATPKKKSRGKAKGAEGKFCVHT